MISPRKSVLTTTNFKVWQESVKKNYCLVDLNIWRLFCEGYDEYSPSTRVMKKNAQARHIIFENLHNANLEKVRDLKSAKEVWDRLHMLYGARSNNSGEEVEKRSKKKKKKKKRYKKNKALVELVVQQDNKFKGISHNDLLLSYNFL